MAVETIPPQYRGTATPYLIVTGAADAIAFYQRAFGAVETIRLADPTGKIAHAEIQIGGAPLMLADEFPDMNFRSPSSLGGSPVTVMLYVENVDAFFANAIAGGATMVRPVEDHFMETAPARFKTRSAISGPSRRTRKT